MKYESSNFSRVTAYLFFSTLFLYYFAIPSLSSRGFETFEPFMPVVLIVFLSVNACHLLLSFAGNRPASSTLVLILAPLGILISSTAKFDFNGILAPIVSMVIVASASTWEAAMIRPAFLRVSTAAILVSIVVSAVDKRFAFPDRDFLPFLISGRAAGLMHHPNALGLVSCLVVGAAISWGPAIRVGPLLVGSLGLLASASQTSIIATTLGVMLMSLAATARRFRPGFFGLLCICFLSLVVLALVLESFGLFSVPTVNYDRSLTGRTDIWEALLHMDVGLFGLTDTEFTSVTEAAGGVGSAHNLWLEAWARAGVPGLSLTMAAVTLLLAQAFGKRLPTQLFMVPAILTFSATEGVLLSAPFIAFIAALLQGTWLGKSSAEEDVGVAHSRDVVSPRGV